MAADLIEVQNDFSGGANSTVDPELIPRNAYVTSENMEIRDHEARTRRGSFRLFVDVTGQDFQGAELFNGINDNLPPEQIMVAQGDKIKRLIRLGTQRLDLVLPDDLETDRVLFVQALDDIFIFRGAGYPVWKWDGDIDNDIEILEVPTRPLVQMPGSDRVLYEYSRFWVVTGRDTVNVSDILSEAFDPNNAIDISKGKDGEKIVALFPFPGGNLLAFKEKSIVLIGNANIANLTITNLTQDFVDNEYGLVSPDAVVAVGKDVWFLSRKGIMTILLNEQQKHQLGNLPISSNIEGIINRINLRSAGGSQMTNFDNYVLTAVPLDSSATNNAIIVYDQVNRVFVGLWLGHDVRKFLVIKEGNEDKLYYINNLGGMVQLQTGLYEDFVHSKKRHLEFRDASSTQFVDITPVLSGTDKIDTQTTGKINMNISIESLADGNIFICTEPVVPEYMRIYMEGGLLKAELKQVAGVRWNLTLTKAPPLKRFINISLEHDGTAPTLYLSGAKLAQTFTAPGSLDKTKWFVDITAGAPPVVRLGNNGTSGGGTISPVFAFDGDIESIIFTGDTGFDDIKANWPMHEGTGLTITDTRNAKAGTLGTAPADPDWDTPPPAAVDIPFKLTMRAFTHDRPHFPKAFTRSEIRFSHRSPKLSLKMFTDEVFDESDMITDQTYDKTKFKIHGVIDFVPSNVNNDHNDPYREDYAPLNFPLLGITFPDATADPSGIFFEQLQEHTELLYDILVSARFQPEITNTEGFVSIKDVTIGVNDKQFAGERSMAL